MEQTYDARSKKIPCNADILIRDEHHIGWNGSRFAGIYDSARPELVIGFSATPYDNYGVAIPGYETASFIDIKRLTNDGYLAEAETIIPEFGQNINLGSIKGSADYSESELDNLLNNDEYNGAVVNAYREHLGGYKAIGFVSGIEHAQDLTDEFISGEINAGVLHSKLSAKVRSQTMDDFKSGEIDVLISVSMLTTGFDMPECNAVINCRPTKVRSLYVQMMGRVLRIGGEDDVRILDCCRATLTHGLYDEPFTIFNSRSAAREERKRRSEPIIDYLSVGKSFISPTKSDLDQGNIDVYNDLSDHALVWVFENADNAKDLLDAACDLYCRFYGVETAAKTKRWILEVLVRDVKSFGITPFRTRLRNIIKDGKKIAGIRYFGDWLKKQQWS